MIIGRNEHNQMKGSFLQVTYFHFIISQNVEGFHHSWFLSNPDSRIKFLNRSVNGHLLSEYRHMAEKAFIALSDE